MYDTSDTIPTHNNPIHALDSTREEHMADSSSAALHTQLQMLQEKVVILGASLVNEDSGLQDICSENVRLHKRIHDLEALAANIN